MVASRRQNCKRPGQQTCWHWRLLFAALISEVDSRTADWFRFQNQRSGCCKRWLRQELDSRVGSRIDDKKTDIKVNSNNCAGRQTTAELVAGLMIRTDKQFVRKVATQISHLELNWVGLVAGRHTKRKTHANAQALNAGHVKKSLDLLIRVA